MFLNATRMRYSTDCGIAALATATGKAWDACSLNLIGKGSYFVTPETYCGVTQYQMQLGIATLMLWDETMPSGAPLTSAKGQRGVVLVRVEHAELEGQRHWLAWEKDEHGRVWLYNPTDGEVFRAESMTGRGFYQLCHFTIA